MYGKVGNLELILIQTFISFWNQRCVEVCEIVIDILLRIKLPSICHFDRQAAAELQLLVLL